LAAEVTPVLAWPPTPNKSAANIELSYGANRRGWYWTVRGWLRTIRK